MVLLLSILMELVARITKNPTTAEITTAMATTTQNPQATPSKGTETFMSHKLSMSVGTEMMSVLTARNFMTMFTLLEMTEAKASMVPVRMSR